jgi:predicted outer membrane protein
MIRTALKLLAILVVGILIYNFFLGTDSEKENAKKIFTEVKDVGVAVKDLLKSEKQKFDAGKYDKAVEKIGTVLDKLKANAKEFDEQYVDRIEELDRKRKELEQDLAKYQDQQSNGNQEQFTPKGGKDSAEIKKELEQLLRETEGLVKEMESNN